jgi:pilus assembly protein FimV
MGQKLDAEIEFSALTAVEAESLTIRLASPETFVQAGIDYPPVLRSLRFTVEKKGDRHVIRVNSDLAINDPFLNVLIEINAAGNRNLRQYALLLDPPIIPEAPIAVNPPVTVAQIDSIRNEKAGAVAETKAATAADNPSKTTVPNSVTTATNNSTSTSTSNVTQPKAPASVPTKSGKHIVKRGETLAAIAAANRPEGASVNQMMLALQRENLQAFSDNNINRLKADSVLSIPDDDAVRAIDADKAREFMRLQNAEFQRYREQLARSSMQSRDSAATSSSATDAGQRGVRSSSGTVTPQSKESAAVPAAQDKLKLTAPAPERLSESDKYQAVATKDGIGGGNPGNAITKHDLNTETLDKIASEKALADANSRIAALEKNISDMRQLTNIQSQSLAEKQAAADQSSSTTVTPPLPTAAPVPQQTPATASSATKSVVTPKVASNAPSTPEPGPVQLIYENVIRTLQPLVQEPTSIIAGVGVLFLLMLSWFGLRHRRRHRSPEEKPPEMEGSQSVFGQAGGRNVDTSNSVFHSNFVPSVSQLDTNEVDAVAEADVYIAYGRDEQAEEILQDALRVHPDRHALRVKLLEIYAARKDRQKFGTLAAELRVLTHGVGEAWVQAAQIGMVLDPGNLLYGAALPKSAEFAPASTKPAPVQPAVTNSPVADFGLRLEGLLDERRHDITTSTPNLPSGGHLATAKVTTPDTPARNAATDLSNALEFNLSDSFSSSSSVSNSSLPFSALNLATQKSNGLVMPEGDLASLKTKLDLAIACQEIGDHEGARELLAEVAGSPNSELAQRAQSLLGQLA